MKRVIIAAIVGALIVFFTSAVIHMFTPLGTAGMKLMPNEDAVVEALRTNLTESAVYPYPGMDMQKQPTPEEEKTWMDKLHRGPSGLIIHTAQGTEFSFPKSLGLEFLTVLVTCFIAAWILSRQLGTYVGRAITVAMLAVFAFFALTASHWIWYNFPTNFILAEGVGELIAYLFAGFAIAKIVPPPLPQA